MSQKRQTESEETERDRFYALTDALVSEGDPEKQKRLKEELARLTFGE